MKLPFSPTHSSPIEPLEARIAPAVIDIGYPVNGNQPPIYDTKYTTASTDQFHPVIFHPAWSGSMIPDPSHPGQMIPDPLAVAPANAQNTYYLELHTGDQVHYWTNAEGYGASLVKYVQGNVVAYFTDLNNDGVFGANELTGVAMGNGARLQLGTSLNGDLAVVLNDTVSATHPVYSIDPGIGNSVVGTNTVLGKNQNIGGFVDLAGGVQGDILVPGNIVNVAVVGNVHNVLAGTAANGAKFDFFRLVDPQNPNLFLAPRFTFDYTQPDGHAGSSLYNVSVGSLGTFSLSSPFVAGKMQAGNGGLGANGGSLFYVQVKNETNAFSLIAGDGGAAGNGYVNGGMGGWVYQAYVSGVSDVYDSTRLTTDLNAPSNQLITVHAGAGGNAGTTGHGGAGGALYDVYLGYDAVGGKLTSSTPLLSNGSLQNNFDLSSGVGGSGIVGGVGGGISAVILNCNTPGLAGNEIFVHAGDGGDAVYPNGGAAGAGGSLNEVIVFDNNVPAAHQPLSQIVAQAGNGGAANNLALGGAGGNVFSTSLLGFATSVLAGDGTNGKVGGAGGSVVQLSLLQGVGVLNQQALINAGYGGDGSNGAGGAGGLVAFVNVPTADYTSFQVNTGEQGNGGAGHNGVGGAGGYVAAVTVSDIDAIVEGTANTSLVGFVNIRSGDGGPGTLGGGAGGNIGWQTKAQVANLPQTQFFGAGLDFTLTAGHGGTATVGSSGTGGAGGAGGSIANVNVVASDNVSGQATDVGIHVTAGVGGDGAGKGSGGAGGSLGLVHLNASGDVSFVAGNGGNGQATNGAFAGTPAGVGGSIALSSGFSTNGSGYMHAGDAGVVGKGAAAGGGLLGISGTLVALRAFQDITMVAGDGSHGGAGGDVSNASLGSSAATLIPTPNGNILVQAGNGSGDSGQNTAAGRGGWVSYLTGEVSSGAGATTTVTAGQGGASGTSSGAGGWLYDIRLNEGGAPVGAGVAPGLLTLAAGDAGSSPGAAKGADGGSVNTVAVGNMTTNLILRSIAAGDGGSAAAFGGVGGNGGSVTKVAVIGLDIGVRTGQVFGYNQAGGLFVGMGGLGKIAGNSGSAEFVNANAIASIVAGKSQTNPQEANKVDHIYVNDSRLILGQQDFVLPGSYTLQFGTDTTTPLPADASTTAVANALNALPSIQAQGGVTVSPGLAPGVYVVHFGNTGAQMQISGTESLAFNGTETVAASSPESDATEVTPGTQMPPAVIVQPGETPLGPTITVAGQLNVSATETQVGNPATGAPEQQVFSIADVAQYANGGFTLSYTSVANGTTTTNTTAVLPVTANATQIANALNGLASVQADGGVTVQTQGGGVFQVTFSVPSATDTVLQVGKLFPQSEHVNLGVIAGNASETFTLSFTEPGMPPLSSSTIALPGNATASTVAAALNALPSIQATGPGGMGGSVNVTGSFTSGFDIQFANAGNQSLITGVTDQPQMQKIDLTGIQSAGANGSFTLSFVDPVDMTTGTTAALPVTAHASDIQSALNGLKAIMDSAPGGTGSVTVTETQPGSHVFVVTFNSNGAQGAINETATVPEVQSLNVSLVDNPTGQFTLSFGGKDSTTVIMPYGEAPATVASQIQTALNGLSTIQGLGQGNTGSVTVTPAGMDNYSITFSPSGETGTVGSPTVVIANGQVLEQQQIEVFAPQKPPVFGATAATGDFVLNFGGQSTAVIPGGSSAATVQAAFNQLLANEGYTENATVTQVVAPGYNDNAVYQITFPVSYAGGVVTATQTEPLQDTVIQHGSTSLVEIQSISPALVPAKGTINTAAYPNGIPRGAFIPTNFAAKQMVGSIYDVNAINANVFHFVPTISAPGGDFVVGDQPIDGIVMAKTLDQKTINFTPEAELIGTTFFDNLDQI